MWKKIPAYLLITFSLAFFAFLELHDYSTKIQFVNTIHQALVTPAYADSHEGEFDVDDFCEDDLLGSMSQETCATSCPGGPADCVNVRTHYAKDNPNLPEDIKCYACDTFQSCYDLGLIYGGDCPWCEINPKKMCVSVVGGGPVPIAVTLPKDTDGFQCWQCINRPDTCNRHFPGSTWKSTCENTCKNKKDHKCVLAGPNPDGGPDCYHCRHFPPPKTCKDVGLRYKNECKTCPAGTDCGPVFWPFGGGPIVDQKGKACFDCFPKLKTCEQQGLKSKCAADEDCVPTAAPNGANCCTCKKKPKDCSTYGWEKDPCQNCKEDEYPLSLPNVRGIDNNGNPITMNCCSCQKNACHPDLEDYMCYTECVLKGKECKAHATKVRGKPRCYYCVDKYVPPKNCDDLERPSSCSPNPCQPGETCQMLPTGKGFDCAYCDSPDTPPPPNNCQEHPTHKWPNCAPCFAAQMACDQKDGCAKCLPPIDERCPQGTIEGACSGPWCVEGLKCVDANVPGKQCHYCVPPEECAPGRYRTPDCDNKCEKGKEACRRIQGCEYGYCESPSDLAIIEQMDPEEKYCGPDMTEILRASLSRIRSRASNLSDDEKGLIDGTMFLDKNGMNIDLRVSPVTNASGNSVCPSEPCKAGTMGTVSICGQCVMYHIANDILFGFMANQVEVPWHVQLAGAHYAEYTSYGGLDPLASQAAYMMGNDASEAMNKNPGMSEDELCSIFKKSGIKTGAFTTTPGFSIMGEEYDFLKDCKPCLFTESKVLKDYSTGDWKLEDGGHTTYADPNNKPEYCCYECQPIETPVQCEDSQVGPCGANNAPCSEGQRCVPIGNECHLCVAKPECPSGWSDGKCPAGPDICKKLGLQCVEVETTKGKWCHNCEGDAKYCQNMYPGSVPAYMCTRDCKPRPPKECKDVGNIFWNTNDGYFNTSAKCQLCVEKNTLYCDPQKGEYPKGSNCSGRCELQDKVCLPIPGHDLLCESCQEKPKEETPPPATSVDPEPKPAVTTGTSTGTDKRKCHEIDKSLFYQPDCAWCVMYGGECNPSIQDDFGVRCMECMVYEHIGACKEKGWKYGGCNYGRCKEGEVCVPHSIDNPKDKIVPKIYCHECIVEDSSGAYSETDQWDPGSVPAAGSQIPSDTYLIGPGNIKLSGSEPDCVGDNCQLEVKQDTNGTTSFEGQYAGTGDHGLFDEVEPYGQPDTGTQTPAKKTCKDLGFDGDFDECQAICRDKPGGACTRSGRNDDFDKPCWKCKSDEDKNEPVTTGTDGTTAVGTGDTTIGTVPGGGVTTVSCDEGYTSGSCLEQSGCPIESCFQSGGCFICRQAQECKPYYLTWADCEGCFAQGGECVPVNAQGDPIAPPGIRGPLDGISGATPLIGGGLGGGFGGGEVHSCMISTLNPPSPGGSQCYACVPRDTCEAHGEVCHCSACPQGTVCLPGTLMVDAQNRDAFLCKKCVPQDMMPPGIRITSIEVTYVIIIIETPRGRIILIDGFNPSSLTNFSPSSVMALVKADGSAVKNIEKLAQLAKAGGGGMSIASIGEIGSLLSELADKKRSYSDDCFDGFEAVEPPQDLPAQGASKKRKKNDPPPASKGSEAYGEDVAQEVVIDGPVIACGKKDGKDVLAIFDANGANVETILKDTIKENPNAVTDALTKAEAAYQKFSELQKATPQSLLKKFASTLTSKLAAPREPVKPPKKKKKKKGKEINIEPNDPLYWPDYGKKKSKVKAKMKKVAAGAKSSLMGGTLGGGGGGISLGASKRADVNDQWGIRHVGFLPFSDAESAWSGIDLSQPNTLVAVIDSGFDFSHPDGPTYVWTNEKEVPDNGIDDDNNGYVDDVHGWNFLDNNNDLRDFKGHGTFVAGIIAAKTNNGVGIAGINPGAVILPLKVANEEGETDSLSIFRAINYAVNQGARVINISMGGRGISKLEQSAINRARKRGIFVAVASGNVNEDISIHGPASSLGTFAVGSLDADNTKSTISNWGANNGLIAPGEEIYSLRSASSFDKRKVSKDTEFYYKMSGTSFSTPMVAATASLMIAKNPNLTAKEIEDILHATADDLYAPGWDGESGAGLLNATKALQQSPNGLLTVKFNKIQGSWNKKKKIEYVDVYATVRGEFESFALGLGKGVRAKKFKQLAGPFTASAENTWIYRIPDSDLKGSKDWILQLDVKDKSGQSVTAQSSLSTSKP